jgi:hypothetical protein
MSWSAQAARNIFVSGEGGVIKHDNRGGVAAVPKIVVGGFHRFADVTKAIGGNNELQFVLAHCFWLSAIARGNSRRSL